MFTKLIARDKPEGSGKSPRLGVNLNVGQEVLQIKMQDRVSRKDTWEGVQQDMLITVTKAALGYLRITYSVPPGIYCRLVKANFKPLGQGCVDAYPEILKHIESPGVSKLVLGRLEGQSIVIRLSGGVHVMEGLKDLASGGIIVKAYQEPGRDGAPKLVIHASEIWNIARLELTRYVHPNLKEIVQYAKPGT